jgi:hypothetical protein
MEAEERRSSECEWVGERRRRRGFGDVDADGDGEVVDWDGAASVVVDIFPSLAY